MQSRMTQSTSISPLSAVERPWELRGNHSLQLSLGVDDNVKTQREDLNHMLCSTCNEIVSITNPKSEAKRDSWKISFSFIEERARRGCPLCLLLLSAFSASEKEKIRHWDSELCQIELPRLIIFWKAGSHSSLGLTYNPDPPNHAIRKFFHVLNASCLRGKKRTFL
jgi:hypothetical protein